MSWPGSSHLWNRGVAWTVSKVSLQLKCLSSWILSWSRQMSGVSPEGSGDQPWPRGGSAFPLGSDPCFILRHSYHFLVQRRHFSNPQTEWVLEAQRRELRSPVGLTCQLLSSPCSQILSCPFFTSKAVPPKAGGGGPPPTHCLRHIACKTEKMQSPESSLLRAMRPLCFVQLIHIFPYRLNLRIFCFIPGTLFICSAVETGFQGTWSFQKVGSAFF